MSIMPRAVKALVLTTALTMPSLALAQNQDTPATADPAPPASTPPAEATDAQPAPEQEQQQQEQVQVSVPGGAAEPEIVVRGRRGGNEFRNSSQVVSVLSAEQIARTGEGNIAGSLGRVTGLSVVGSGYVYVRGLGDRYSLALLNGSPLPSPEPLKRVVPLDLFPTSVISSSLVQKSYSVNYPGEFGGGVINLTTKTAPRDAFLSIGGSISGDTFTTGNLGYTYYGSSSDWTGFDDGARDIPPRLQAFLDSGQRLSSGTVDSTAIASDLITGRNAIVQRNTDIPANWSVNIAGGRTFDVGGSRLGVIFGAGYSNKWLTREARQQVSLNADISDVESDFRRVITDNRLVLNGLLGFGLEFGRNQLRWTNLYIHDTNKQARLGIGNRAGTNVDFLQQGTAWFERQLINTQLVAELRPSDAISIDLRGSYANSKRKAPFEIGLEYARTNSDADPFGNLFVNRLNNGNRGDATISFSDLNEDLWSGGADVTYRFTPAVSVTVGGAYVDQNRDSSRRDFRFLAPSDFSSALSVLRPDVLLSPGVIQAGKITLIETNEGNPEFNALLRNYAGYARLNARFLENLTLDAGVRFERAKQIVSPIQVFADPGASLAGTDLRRSYWLPAATLTWQMRPDLQLRFSASKTIARPQFRELIFQFYFDPDSNREYQGNPLLVDSQLYNAEGRLEYFFGPNQRVSLSGFYKRINRPIESFITQLSGDLLTSFANAPKANLYGAELEVQKNFSLAGLGSGIGGRRLVTTGNYTFSQSKLKVRDGDTTAVFGASSSLATDYFRNGAPLTGQSDHLANLELSVEHPDRLSQQTLLLTYASKRVVSRGLNGSPPQPDVVEVPGLRLDFVAREGIDLWGRELELKFEARNLTGRGHVEFQEFGSNRIDVNTYDLGRVFSLGASVKF